MVKAQKDMVWLQHMGAVVPVKVNDSTRFEDPTLKKATDLKEGQQVRARIEVQGKTNNVARSISMDNAGTGGSGVEGWGDPLDGSGTGGSGAGDIQNTPPTPMDPLPEEPGTQGGDIERY